MYQTAEKENFPCILLLLQQNASDVFLLELVTKVLRNVSIERKDIVVGKENRDSKNLEGDTSSLNCFVDKQRIEKGRNKEFHRSSILTCLCQLICFRPKGGDKRKKKQPLIPVLERTGLNILDNVVCTLINLTAVLDPAVAKVLRKETVPESCSKLLLTTRPSTVTELEFIAFQSNCCRLIQNMSQNGRLRRLVGRTRGVQALFFVLAARQSMGAPSEEDLRLFIHILQCLHNLCGCPENQNQIGGYLLQLSKLLLYSTELDGDPKSKVYRESVYEVEASAARVMCSATYFHQGNKKRLLHLKDVVLAEVCFQNIFQLCSYALRFDRPVRRLVAQLLANVFVSFADVVGVGSASVLLWMNKLFDSFTNSIKDLLSVLQDVLREQNADLGLLQSYLVLLQNILCNTYFSVMYVQMIGLNDSLANLTCHWNQDLATAARQCIRLIEQVPSLNQMEQRLMHLTCMDLLSLLASRTVELTKEELDMGGILFLVRILFTKCQVQCTTDMDSTQEPLQTDCETTNVKELVQSGGIRFLIKLVRWLLLLKQDNKSTGTVSSILGLVLWILFHTVKAIPAAASLLIDSESVGVLCDLLRTASKVITVEQTFLPLVRKATNQFLLNYDNHFHQHRKLYQMLLNTDCMTTEESAFIEQYRKRVEASKEQLQHGNGSDAPLQTLHWYFIHGEEAAQLGVFVLYSVGSSLYRKSQGLAGRFAGKARQTLEAVLKKMLSPAFATIKYDIISRELGVFTVYEKAWSLEDATTGGSASKMKRRIGTIKSQTRQQTIASLSVKIIQLHDSTKEAGMQQSNRNDA